MNEVKYVIKRSGAVEELMPEKFMLVCIWACEGIARVSASDLSIRAANKLHDRMTTKEIHHMIIRTAVDMMDEETNYERVAARLLNFDIRKDVYGSYDVPHLYDIMVRNTAEGYYTDELLQNYTKEEIDELNSYLDHSKDNTLTLAAVRQFEDKYLVQDRSTKTLYETPQISYILVAATLFMSVKDKAKRMKHIKNYYNVTSEAKISLPTPIMAGVRTPTKQFSSCVLIGSGDSLDSIKAAGNNIISYVARKAGIGLHAGSIRAVGSKVRDGSISHTGVVPFLKKFKGDLKSCSQGL